MQRRGYHSLSLPVRGSEANDEPARAGDGGGNSDDHLVDAQDFRNMRLAIGKVERSIFEMSLSDNLAGTRHIDIRLRQNSVGSNVAGPDGQAVVVEPGSGSRLKITVAADEPKANADDKDYLNQMRGWLMTVATLFVGITFQAAIQPPQWVSEDSKTIQRVEDANTMASGPVAAPSGSSSISNKASLYASTNGMAFSLALYLVLVRRRTPDAEHVMIFVRITMPCLFLAVGFTYVVATNNGYSLFRVAMFSVLVAYAVLTTAFILGKLRGCTGRLRNLFRR